MRGPTVVWIGMGVCAALIVVAGAVAALRRPCIDAGPRGPEPLLVLLGAVVGTGILGVLAAVDAPGWVDVAVTAAVIGPLVAYGVAGGIGWIRDRRRRVTVDVWVDRDRAGVR